MHSRTFIIFSVCIGLLILGGWFVAWDWSRDTFHTLETEIFETEVMHEFASSMTIEIDGIKVNVDVAETAQEKAQGLSGKTSLKEDEGMLFVYEESGLYSFWMKDMNFPIDIIWIDKDLKVVDITENFQQDSFPQTVEPQKKVQYVLEVNAGWAEDHQIHIGSPVVFNSNNTKTFANVLFDVPFTPQAVFGNWADIRQSNACEEASALMAMRWVDGKDLPLKEAEEEIIAIADYELEAYGHFHDTSAKDTVERIFNDYFKYKGVSVRYNINSQDIKKELDRGNLVIVPVNGQKLGNPYYTPPGPLIHMVVIRGYDDTTKEFITNDPGTKRGEEYRYDYQVIENALRDYNSGYQELITKIQTAMIIVSPR